MDNKIENIRNTLRNFAEDMKEQMSANAYCIIWDIIQSIERESINEKT